VPRFQKPATYYLTCLFLTKPRLAQYVRHFTLRDPYRYHDIQSKGDETWSLHAASVFKEATLASSHSAEESEEWMMHVAADEPDALLSILLPTLSDWRNWT
jgi:hypothetical protein